MSYCDFEPTYLQQVFVDDLYEINNLWTSNINDMDLLQEIETIERHFPITEDISLDDEVLCSAVEQIEYQ